MPKLKTKSSVKKRFKITGTGKVLAGRTLEAALQAATPLRKPRSDSDWAAWLAWKQTSRTGLPASMTDWA